MARFFFFFFFIFLIFTPLGDFLGLLRKLRQWCGFFLKKDAKGFFSIDVYPILCGDATREISRQIPKRALVIRSSITSYPRNNLTHLRYHTFSIADSKLITSFVAITCRFNRSFARSLDILAPTTCTRQQVALDNDTRPANAFSSTFIYFDSYFFFFPYRYRARVCE